MKETFFSCFFVDVYNSEAYKAKLDCIVNNYILKFKFVEECVLTA